MQELKNADMTSLPVRAVQIVCINNPQWGTWGVMEDHGDWYDIRGDRGDRILFKSEAVQFWRIA